MKRMIFHIPLRLNPNLKSASQIRPVKMLQAFRNIGYEVDVVEGSAKERRESINKIKQNIRTGTVYDFVYSESSTTPTLLTESHHYPTHPFLDFDFFRFCKKHGIKIGLFYRDIYWCFPDYVTGWKTRIATLFYKYDIIKYNQLVDTLFVPSKEMINFLPMTVVARVRELPAGCEVFGQEMKIANDNIELFYVGGIGHHYDLTMVVKVLTKFPNIHLTLCCRKEDWEIVKDEYIDILPENVEIIHKSGKELIGYFTKADLGILYVKPSVYRAFAMPYKLMEFIGHGLPVLASNGTKTAQFVSENNCGYVVDYSEEALIEFFSSMSKAILNNKKNEVYEFAFSQTWEERARFVVKCLTQK